MALFFKLLFALCLLGAPAWAQKPSTEKGPEAICQKLEAARGRYLQQPDASCWSANPFSSSRLGLPRLDKSYKFLQSYFAADKGLVAGCKKVLKRMDSLNAAREKVHQDCKDSGVASAKSTARTKSKEQAGIIEAQAKLMDNLQAQRAQCSANVQKLVQDPESKADSYSLLWRDVSQVADNFADRGINELENISIFSSGSEPCRTTARNYDHLIKETTNNLHQLNRVVFGSKERAGNSVTNFSREAKDAQARAEELRARIKKLGRGK